MDDPSLLFYTGSFLKHQEAQRKRTCTDDVEKKEKRAARQRRYEQRQKEKAAAALVAEVRSSLVDSETAGTEASDPANEGRSSGAAGSQSAGNDEQEDITGNATLLPLVLDRCSCSLNEGMGPSGSTAKDLRRDGCCLVETVCSREKLLGTLAWLDQLKKLETLSGATAAAERCRELRSGSSGGQNETRIKLGIIQNFQRIQNTNWEAYTNKQEKGQRGRYQLVLHNESVGAPPEWTRRVTEPCTEFLEKVTAEIRSELRVVVVAVFCRALACSEQQLFNVFDLRKIVIVWPDNGAQPQYTHVDCNLNVNKSVEDDCSLFALINVNPAQRGRQVGVYKQSHMAYDCVNRSENCTERIADVRVELPDGHILKGEGSTLHADEICLDFLQALVCDMSLCHYGTAGPSVKEDASKAFAIHAVVVPKADHNDEEFDSLQRPVGILKDVLVPAGGNLYMHSGKVW